MFYKLLKRSALHPTELQIIELIASNQMLDGWCELPKSHIAKELKLSPSRIFCLLHALTQKGFIIKSEIKNNKHQSLYKTTPRWKTLEERVKNDV